jgi:two-component system chemotaxis sensor kinase CheA
MEESYGAVPGVGGATILGNGRVALILDVDKLSELATSQQNPVAAAAAFLGEPSAHATVN